MVGTSALIAILFEESDAERFSKVMAFQDLVIAAPTRSEFLMVATGRRGEIVLSKAREILEVGRVRTIDWDESLIEIAADAFLRFGKGRHPGKLNFGDCMAYALAKSLDAPLLFKGDDFTQTDIKSAL